MYFRMLRKALLSMTAPMNTPFFVVSPCVSFFVFSTDLLQHLVVDVLDDDGPGAGRALLALEPEGAGHDGVGGRVQVGRLVHDLRVLAAHLQDGALEPDLALVHLGGPLEDAQPHLLGPGEGDHAGERVVDQGVADLAAGPGQERQRLLGQAGLVHDLGRTVGDGGRRGGGLQHHGVARDQRGGAHAAHDGGGEVPRRDDEHHAQGT
jgi:hypothetical protein